VTLRAPEPLASQHWLEGFDCGKPALNDWLLRHARQAQGSGSAKTFVVADDDDRVAGYFSLTVGQVDTLEAPERIRKGMGKLAGVHEGAVPGESQGAAWLGDGFGCTRASSWAWAARPHPGSESVSDISIIRLFRLYSVP